MAWLFVDAQVNNTFASIGTLEGDVYKLNEDCILILQDILSKLLLEDSTQFQLHRIINAEQHIRKHLQPLLLNVKATNKFVNQSQAIAATIKILVHLTTPLECLSLPETNQHSQCLRTDVNQLLSTTKELFATETRLVKAVLDHMKFLTVKKSNLNLNDCDCINDCLILMRNVLHIPDTKLVVHGNVLVQCTVQSKLLWNLFAHGVDKIILQLLAFPQKIYWVPTLAQLIALMYKDQQVTTLQQLLALWYETSATDTSEDNESNTSPPNFGSSDDSLPILTSDPTSDSSDSGHTTTVHCKTDVNCNDVVMKQIVIKSSLNKNKNILMGLKNAQRRSSDGSSTSTQTTDSKSGSSITFLNQPELESTFINKDIQSEQSDYGYGTQLDNPGSISTSSNEDELLEEKLIQHKVRYKCEKTRNVTNQDKKKGGRKKLINRSKIKITNMKSLMYHIPTNEAITNVLKEFTVDFLLKGYGSLIQGLYNQLLKDNQFIFDTSHFFWLITYFLKFAVQLELDFEHIKPVLSFEIISYLTYESINLYEQLEMSLNRNNNLKPYLRRIHLVITAIRQFFETINVYKTLIHLSTNDQLYLSKLEQQISKSTNLRNLFLFLIERFNPEIQSNLYLQDLIVTNHLMLLFLDKSRDESDLDHSDLLLDHLKQFANATVMKHYGLLLENYETNGRFVNDCVLTMMHHVGGDLDNVGCLLQPNIVKTFSEIWESNYQICDDWFDLIKYVINTFLNISKYDEDENLLEIKDSTNYWTTEDNIVLNNYYVQSINCDNLIESIENLYIQSGVNKRRASIINQMFHQKLINKNQHEEFMEIENIKKINLFDEVLALREQIRLEGLEDSLPWLQQMLLDTCHCKVAPNTQTNRGLEVEPVPYCYIKLNQAIPIVPWNNQYSNLLKNKTFHLLLDKLGFHLPTDTQKLFVRIPNFWTADYLFTIAQQLGPINLTQLKFNTKLLKRVENSEYIHDKSVQVLNIYHFGQPEPDLPVLNVQCTTLSTLTNKVLRNRSTPHSAVIKEARLLEKSDESIDFDLTRMYVSDEEKE